MSKTLPARREPRRVFSSLRNPRRTRPLANRERALPAHGVVATGEEAGNRPPRPLLSPWKRGVP